MLGEIVGISPLKWSYLVYWQNETYSEEFVFNLERVEQIKEGTFGQIDRENETPRYVPLTLPDNTNFSKTLLNELLREKIDNVDELYGQIPQISKVSICVPSLKCGAWSDCRVVYTLESILNMDNIEGLSYKLCTDVNNCISDIVGSKVCVSKINITLEQGFWCGKEYIEVKDKNGKILTRLDTKNQSNYLDVDINLGENYCFYCYDHKKNYDETDIDCGGSCKTCSKVEQKI